jgi:hypothetical protein
MAFELALSFNIFVVIPRQRTIIVAAYSTLILNNRAIRELTQVEAILLGLMPQQLY